MSDEEVFGPVVSASEIQLSAISVISIWMPEYIAWIERHIGYDPHTMPPVATVTGASTLEGWYPVSPGVIVLLPRLHRPRPRRSTEHVLRDGAGVLSATYELSVVVALPGDMEYLVADYTAALRTLLLQKGTLYGHVDGIELIGERHGLRYDGENVRWYGRLRFHIRLAALANVYAGPPAARPDPYAPYLPASPLVELTELVVDADIDD
jgi:hypothetical protein